MNILMIEDDLQICEVTKKYFTNKGAEITTVTDGKAALEICGENLDAYSLVLLDIMLPGADGFTICRSIRRNSNIPVIFITAREPEKLMNHRKYTATFDVIYYADTENETDDMLRVCTDLPLLLETITTPSGAKVHPEDAIEPEMQDDGTVHCIVRFGYHVFARRVHVDDQGNETPYDIHGELDDTELMRVLDLRLPPNEEE